MSSEATPRLVIIVADGPLMAGKPKQLAGRSAIHITLASPPMPPAAIATTIATGVSPLVHGIVKMGIVDRQLFTIREAVATDVRYQTFWKKSGLRVKLINWPATGGDDEVTNQMCQDEFDKAKSLLGADVVGILLPRLSREESTPELVQATQHKLEQFLGLLSVETKVIIVHRRTKEDGAVLKTVHVLGATLLVDTCEFNTDSVTYLEVIGGAVYVLAEVPCPTGIKLPQWPFITPFIKEETRLFPSNPIAEDVDWKEVIQSLLESNNTASLTLLTQRFTTLTSISFRSREWESLKSNSSCLVQLQGKPFHYWMLILALEQQGKFDELREAVELVESKYPNKYLTKIAKCFVELDQEIAKETLQLVDINKMGVYHAIGAYGRMCLKAGMDEQGAEAIESALEKKVGIPADRAVLASYYYKKEQYKKALRVIGLIGTSGNELSWQSLRLKILMANKMDEQAKQLANKMLLHDSTNELALDVIGKLP
ncbi:MAG: hypothetical protein HOC27_06020 [Phycisphaerae bacterium]|nr:hypothetical protein [Phycisphaerae bacterium]